MRQARIVATRKVSDACVVIVQDAVVEDALVSGAFEVFDPDDAVSAAPDGERLAVLVQCTMANSSDEDSLELLVLPRLLNTVIGYEGEVISQLA
jgi:hypothetical protein